jgi:hypothetical protein
MNTNIINYIDNFDYSNLDIKYNEFDLILGGGGFKGYFHTGLCKILKHYEINKQIKIRYIIGSSTGALSAVMYICSIHHHKWINGFYKIKNSIKNSDLQTVVIDLIKNDLPDDAYLLCNGKLKISLSKLTFFGFKHVLIDKFDSNEHLLNVLSASIKIPYLTSNEIFGCRINNNIYYDSFFTRITPIIYNNDLPQLVIKTVSINYLNSLSLKPNDSFIELLVLRGLYESKHFLTVNKNNDSIFWIEKSYSKNKKNKKYIIIPLLFYLFSIIS